ncbi:MAG: XRE family transcriptional regulator [Thermodesulfobacteriota bacterium]
MVSIGKRIKEFRTKRKMSYDRLANETGFSIDYLKQVESGKITPPVGTLLTIARALEIDSGIFLRQQESSLNKRIKAYTQRTDNYAYTTLTPGAENKHLKAFRVFVEPMQEHKGVGYQHEGEEFVYVLSGAVEIQVGEHVNRLEKNESLHFNSGIRHHLKNTGEVRAELLVVIYGA